jgi:hypothetical protein
MYSIKFFHIPASKWLTPKNVCNLIKGVIASMLIQGRITNSMTEHRKNHFCKHLPTLDCNYQSSFGKLLLYTETGASKRTDRLF